MSASVIQISVKPDTPGEVGLPKMSVGQALVKKEGFEGDYNRARKKKKDNDPDMAVMIISTDILDQLNQEGWPVKPGDVGENLTITNIDYKKIAAGQIYLIGEAEIEISFICEPCTNLYKLPYVGTQRGPEFMAAIMNRRGWYARVLKEGLVSVGNTFLLQ